MRIGNSIDYHKLKRNRLLKLGGITIPYNKGLLGDSDADVILHTISEAILGALSLGDLGTYFNKSNAQDLDSAKILEFARDKMIEAGCTLKNSDTTILIEKPKLKEYIPLMIDKISNILNVPKNSISIKATTMEKDGIIGKGKGAMAFTTVLLEDKNDRN